MTEEQKIKARSMRADGVSLQKIGDHFGISKQRVHQILYKPPRTRMRKFTGCVYPNISKWMEENRICASEFSSMIGVSAGTAALNLRGENGPSKKTIDRILEVTGMTYEEAFFQPADDRAKSSDSAIAAEHGRIR